MSAVRNVYEAEAPAPSIETLPKTYVVRPGDWFYLNRRKPLAEEENFAILARIRADNMTFVVLDISNARARGGRRFPFGQDGPSWTGDILIIDVDTFDVDEETHKPTGGHKAAKFGEWLPIGSQHWDEFDYTDGIDEDHFAVGIATKESESLCVRVKERAVDPSGPFEHDQPSPILLECYEPADFMPLELCEQSRE